MSGHRVIPPRLSRWLPVTLAVLAVLCGGIARADGLTECKQMFRGAGAPAYRGEPPEHMPLCRIGYVLSYNLDTKVPDWVLEDLTPDRLDGTADRGGDPFAADPDLPPGRRSELADYKGSGYDRGHMAPAADMKWRQDAMKQSFLLSNMAPQVGIGMNRGIWAQLEDNVRDWSRERGRVIVVSGPVFGKDRTSIGDDGVAVPDSFYKIVFDPGRRRVIAFIMPNQNLAGRKITEFIVTLREVEDRTGLDFLSALAKRDKRQLQTAKSPMWRVAPP